MIGFVAVAVWNFISPWSNEGWSRWFFIQNFVVLIIVAIVSTVWFTWGGTRDLYRLFKALAAKESNVLDDGRVIGHVSADDITMVEKLDHIEMPEAHIEEEILREELEEEGDIEDIKNLDEHTKE